ncbi:hypothetical protein DICA4_E00936 [Diutina catenulata]
MSDIEQSEAQESGWTFFNYKGLPIDETYRDWIVVEYTDPSEVEEYVHNRMDASLCDFYVVQTKGNVYRFHAIECGFDQHALVDPDEHDEEYYLYISAKCGDVLSRIEDHMEQADHSKCRMD